ncbi:MAG: hypothetical protein WCD86_03040, partial [Ktedonobacteraceae bacterium]
EGTALLANLGMNDLPLFDREDFSRRFHGNPGLLKWATDHFDTSVRRIWPHRSADIRHESASALNVLIVETSLKESLSKLVLQNEKPLLLSLSLIRIPVPHEMLELLCRVVGVDVQRVEQAGFLLKSQNGYVLQNEIRYAALAMSEDAEIEAAHHILCACYKMRLYEGFAALPKKTASEAELLYHLLCLGDLSQAAELIAHSKLVTAYNTASPVLQLRDILYATIYLDDPALSTNERAVLAFALGAVTRKATVAGKEYSKPNDLWYYRFAWKTITGAQLTDLIPRIGYRYAYALMNSGELTLAREIMEETLSEALAQKKLTMVNYMYRGLADIALWENDYEVAKAALDHCFALMKDDPVQRELYTPATLHTQARLWYMQGRFREAFVNEMRAARMVIHQNRMLHRLAEYFSFAAVICFALEHLRTAQRLLDRAEYLLHDHYSRRESLFHLRRAHLAALCGQWEIAQNHVEQVGIYYDAAARDAFHYQMLNQVATEIRRAKSWESRHLPTRLGSTPVDYSFAQNLAEFLP